MKKLKVLDLFSGIGGFSLGLERTGGFETVAFCEIDKGCQRVLKKHWPDTMIFQDVKNLEYNFGNYKLHTLKETDRRGWNSTAAIDVICGGFPCQDISVAGKQKGIEDGSRSSLWKEFHRIIKEVQPGYVIIENVANLRSQGYSRVLKDLRALGYVVDGDLIPAAAVGAHSLRERIWIVAARTDSNNFRLWPSFTSPEEKQEWWSKTTASFRDMWSEEKYRLTPKLRGIPNGLPKGLDTSNRERIKQLGNTVFPQLPQLLGQALLDYRKAL